MSRVTEGARSQAKYALEAYNMKTTKSRSCSRIATFMSILLAVVLVATGCAPKANPEPVTDQLFVKEFVSALIDENYTTAATCFAFPIREKELHSWRARIVAAADPGSLSRFQVGVADNFSFGGVQEYVDTDGFRISRDEAFAAIMPTVKKTAEYAKIMKRYGAAMKRLDEAADPSKVDSVTYRDAYQGRIQVDGLCDLLAPKYVVPPADGARCVNVVFMASGHLRSELVTIVRLIPLGSGFGVTDFIIGDTKGE